MTLIVAVGAHADPVSTCHSHKLKAAAKYGRCVAKETTRAEPDLAKCELRYAEKWALAEIRAGQQCTFIGDQVVAESVLNGLSNSLVVALAGGPAPALHYVDNGDGTITDSRTGLMWEKLSDDGSVHDRDNTYTWDEAFGVKIADLNSTAFAGHTDWRLPNVNELQSISIFSTHRGDGSQTGVAFDVGCVPGCTILACSCTQALPGSEWRYWSSTSYHPDPDRAWPVAADGSTVPDTKTTAIAVRGVRDGS